MGDDMRAWNKEGQAKRARNRNASATMLAQFDIPFMERNDGAHLIVADRFDFWPGTGLFIERRTGRKGRGVRNLIANIKMSVPAKAKL